ncbi:hypothetical protein AKJ09_04499 [Labilithrix luteola]|uniref:BNR repeat domain protein n=1 Tax=Labilithrix luteola TaxID=1391654 RepID=A0A0K1PWD5_9BACT|nr:hypothetical protein [Labilithrix luteola]AKU97835.1 hypothetical protein AKJ09_04499 [Labilithrix luteola]
MFITNRLLDRRASSAFVLGTSALGILVAAASCSTTSTTFLTTDETSDASVDAEAGEAAIADAGADADAAETGAVNAATSDAGPPPIQCVDAACAKSLVTTIGGSTAGFCALLDDATVACWGFNDSGQLARPSSVYQSAVPERVLGLKDVVRLSHTCAVDKDGATWCWGTGPFLQSTTNAYSTEWSPVKMAIPTATHVDFMNGSSQAWGTVSVGCAVVEGDSVACWGLNGNGQVRPPTVNESVTAANPVTTVGIPDGEPIQDIFVAGATFLLRTDGTLLSWGAKPLLGRVSSLSPDPRPKPVALTGVTYVDAEGGNACVVAHGSVYCWGATLPQAGDSLSNALPRQVMLPELAVSVATTGAFYGSGSYDPQRGCAVTLSGDVYCWGSNTSGQAGDGTRDFATSPVKVKGLPAPASIVRTDALATCALLTNGKVYCWGENDRGELGNGAIWEPSLEPVEVLLP